MITLIITTIFLYSTNKEILPLVLAIIGFGIVGFVDDFKKLILKDTEGLKPAYKIVGLLIISVIYALFLIKAGIGTGTIIPILKKEIIMPALLYIPFAIFVMLAGTNAINLTDGIDGLGASISMIIIACLSVIAAKYEVIEIAVLGAVLCRSMFRIFDI